MIIIWPVFILLTRSTGMSRVLASAQKLDAHDTTSAETLFKSYVEIWNDYLEDLVRTYSYEDKLFEYMATTAAQYFSSMMSFYKNLNQMCNMVIPTCVLQRLIKSE